MRDSGDADAAKCTQPFRVLLIFSLLLLSFARLDLTVVVVVASCKPGEDGCPNVAPLLGSLCKLACRASTEPPLAPTASKQSKLEMDPSSVPNTIHVPSIFFWVPISHIFPPFPIFPNNKNLFLKVPLWNSHFEKIDRLLAENFIKNSWSCSFGFGCECITRCLFHCPTSAISSGVERSRKRARSCVS